MATPEITNPTPDQDQDPRGLSFRVQDSTDADPRIWQCWPEEQPLTTGRDGHSLFVELLVTLARCNNKLPNRKSTKSTELGSARCRKCTQNPIVKRMHTLHRTLRTLPQSSVPVAPNLPKRKGVYIAMA